MLERWRPPPKRTLSEWADEHFYLSPESSNQPGRWRTLPYQRGIMDAISDPLIERVTLMKSKRVGYTKVITAFLGYRMHQDPGSMLVVQPTVEDAQGYSKDEVAAMIRDCPVLTPLVGEPRARDSDNTLLKKSGPGFTLWLSGANSGRGMRRITVRDVIFDEVDAFPASAGTEGDPIMLGEGRAEGAWDRSIVLGSTPLVKGLSRIEQSYLESDQRHYHVPCPQCDHGQYLKWGGRDEDFGIKWPPDYPEEAYYLCEHCHGRIEHAEKFDIIEAGDWEPANPFQGHAGFHIWAAYSYQPNATWGHLAIEWVRVNEDPNRRRVFINTSRGETYEEKYEAVHENALLADGRREHYPERADGTLLVPRGVVVMTAGMDVQTDRLEIGIEGWGLPAGNEENWKLEYHVVEGDPTGRAVWEDAWKILSRPRQMERGGEDFVRATCVDCGFLAQSVANFVRPRQRYQTPDGRRAYMFSVKGDEGKGSVWPREPNRKHGRRVPEYTIKVDGLKESLYARLQRVVAPGPGFVHIPTTFGARYCEQLTAEKVVTKTDRRGFSKRVWELKSERRPNEALDVSDYSHAALYALSTLGFNLEREAARVLKGSPPPPEHVGSAPTPAPTPTPTPAPTPTSPSPQGRRRRLARSRYLGS